jgi:uncharacterized protein (DUF2461 family)
MHTFRFSYELVNDSKENCITAVFKGGLRYTVPHSRRSDYCDERTHLKVSLESVHLDRLGIFVEEAMSKLDERILLYLKNAKRVIEAEPYYNKDNAVRLSVEVDLGDLFENSNDHSLHSELLGVTWYIGEPRLRVRAKNSMKRLTEQEMVRAFNHCGMSMNIFLVDPGRITNPMYVNVLGKSVQVPIADFEEIDCASPGLFITRGDHKNIPENESYTLDELKDSKLLERLGVFLTKAECDANGNTERFIQAEKNAKDLSRSLEDRDKQLKEAREKLKKADKEIEDLQKTIAEVKSDYKSDMREMKNELKQAAREAKLDSKKSEYKFEQSKSKNEILAWSDILKAGVNLVGSVVGLGKLFS